MKSLLLAAALTQSMVFVGVARAAPPDPWQPLSFLVGTWQADVQGGSAGAKSTSVYSFEWQLKAHVLARVGNGPASCTGPATFDCQHSDLFYVYRDGDAESLKAIYFDNEGHVIHYGLSTPAAMTAVFLSDAGQPGPVFRLVYELKGPVMYGKFQMQMPGQAEWHSYLEWSGTKK